MNYFDTIKKFTEIEKINLEKIMDKFGSDCSITSKHNIRYNCPYCEEKRGKPDSDAKFMIDLETGLYYCFKCHTKGILFNNDVSYSEKILQQLFDYFNVDNEKNKFESNELIKNKLLEFTNVIDIKKDSLAYEYLTSRKITNEHIEYYNIKNGIRENFGRIMIPNALIINWTDYYQGRSYLNAKPKYLNPTSVNKSNIVFNLHRQSKHQKIVYIVEGIFSAILGGKDLICIFGSSVSDNQIKMISNYNFDEIVCSLDGDSPGQLGNYDLANKLIKAGNKNVSIVKLPETEDPGDMGEFKYKEYVNKYKRKYINERIDNILGYFDKN